MTIVEKVLKASAISVNTIVLVENLGVVPGGKTPTVIDNLVDIIMRFINNVAI